MKITYKYLHLGLFLFWVAGVIGGKVVAQSRNFGGGLVLDEKKYEQVPLATPFTNKSMDNRPYKYSLKPYCPNPGDQLGTGTCVGWAASYGAQTIIDAIANNRTRQTDLAGLNKSAFSPSYVYHQTLKREGRLHDCYMGIHISDALEAMQTDGNLKINEYPFDEECKLTPTPDQQNKANIYRLKEFQRVTLTGADNAKVTNVRNAIAANMPVIVGMVIYDNFKELVHENHTWNPDKGEKGQPTVHAMLVVGYDDENQTFELMNSWGTEWANQGFIYVKYSDFNKFVKEAYQLIYSPPFSLASKQSAATIAYYQLGRTGLGNDANCTNEIIGSMRATQNGAVYAMENIYGSEASYQVHLSPKSPDMYVYAFSIDDKNTIDVLYPFNKEIMELYAPNANNTIVSAFVPTTKGSIAIPHQEYCMSLDENTGTVNVFLFSKSKIDLDYLKEKLPATSGNMIERLQSLFPDRIANRKDVTYIPSIGFEANLAENSIVPIIVDLNHLPKKP